MEIDAKGGTPGTARGRSNSRPMTSQGMENAKRVNGARCFRRYPQAHALAGMGLLRFDAI
jgi:hypothetical protein